MNFDPSVYQWAPVVEPDTVRDQTFEQLGQRVMTAGGGEVCYDLPYPIHQFLGWLAARHPILLHGSNHGTIQELRPRKQTDRFGRPTHAVFATGDAIWPLFFAVLDQARFRSTRNDCRETAAGKLYRFSIDRASYDAGPPWIDGFMYILPRGPFTRMVSENGFASEEWTSPALIRPMAKIPVRPADFPFLDAVRGHGSLEDPIEQAFFAVVIGAEAVHEIADGYHLVLPPDRAGMGEHVSAMLAIHTPLPGLAVAVKPGTGGSVDVLMTGPHAVKEALRSFIREAGG